MPATFDATREDRIKNTISYVTGHLVSIYEYEHGAHKIRYNKIKDLDLWDDTFNLVELIKQLTKLGYLDTAFKAEVYDNAVRLLKQNGYEIVSTKRELQLKSDTFKVNVLPKIKEMNNVN